MRGWRIKPGWVEPLLFIYLFGWIPAAIIPDSIWDRGKSLTAFFIALSIWFGPAVLLAAGLMLKHLWNLGPPVERVPRASKIVALQERISELERELQIGESTKAKERHA